MPADLPSDYFTLASLGTLGGASIAVVIVTNTVRKLLGWDSMWVGFILSAAIVFFASYKAGSLASLGQGVIAFFNSCLLFCTAFGITGSGAVLAGARRAATAVATEKTARKGLPWLVSWLHG